MKLKTPGQPQSPCANDNKNSGFIMITTVLIVAAVFSVILIKTALSTITHLETKDISLNALKIQYFTEGCIQEALIQYDRDQTYTGGDFNIGTGSCNVSARLEIKGGLFYKKNRRIYAPAFLFKLFFLFIHKQFSPKPLVNLPHIVS